MSTSGGYDDRPTLLYCRESRDENCANYERIEVQREMLLRFCARQGLVNIVDIILDDDVSGTGFERLAPVLERVRRGEVRVLVFKDGSRLGRNLKESLIFTEAVARLGGEIRFANEEYSEDFFPLKQWFHEQRAKEDSVKIRSVLRHKMETGTLLVRPPYGYRRGENGALLPDGERAEVVRRIFAEALRGCGSAEIAAELNRLGVPTPSQSKGAVNAAPAWVGQHVRRILRDPVYLGTMVHNRCVRKSFKDRRTVTLPREAWVVLEGHHPPLVSREEFARVQRPQNTRRKSGAERPFSGLLRCGRCGRALVLRTQSGRPEAYLCAKYRAEGAVKSAVRPDCGCLAHRVRVDALEEAARAALAALMDDAAICEGELYERALRRLPGAPRRAQLERSLAGVERTIGRIYEDRLSGLIDEALFTEKYRAYTARAEALRAQLAALEGTGEAPPLPPEELAREIVRAPLTASRVRLLFSEIVVYERGEAGETERARLSEEAFAALRENGGVVFVKNWR